MFTFWRNLIGKAPAQTEQATSVADDRRLWMRYATDLQSNVQVSEKGYRDKLLANIRDLSLGGANLHVDRPLPLGQMLSLELHADGECRTILACVVRATAQDDGFWSLGCVFSRELTRADLRRFGAEKVKASDEDQRIWVRYDCTLKASCRLFGSPVSDAQPVQVLNISASGVGLLVHPSLQSGSLLTVDLLDKKGRKAFTILACVVHTTLRASGEFAVGCNFIRELTEEELQSLL